LAATDATQILERCTRTSTWKKNPSRERDKGDIAAQSHMPNSHAVLQGRSQEKRHTIKVPVFIAQPLKYSKTIEFFLVGQSTPR
jgi:hypothetical protein